MADTVENILRSARKFAEATKKFLRKYWEGWISAISIAKNKTSRQTNDFYLPY